jgi:hypothetical protein
VSGFDVLYYSWSFAPDRGHGKPRGMKQKPALRLLNGQAREQPDDLAHRGLGLLFKVFRVAAVGSKLLYKRLPGNESRRQLLLHDGKGGVTD